MLGALTQEEEERRAAVGPVGMGRGAADVRARLRGGSDDLTARLVLTWPRKPRSSCDP